MKPSRYNYFADIDDGKKLAFNSSTAALAEIDPETAPLIEKMLAHGGKASTDRERELLKQMMEAKFLVPVECDEILHLKANNRLRRFGSPTFLLTIAPTLACNFACEYCYETDKSGYMTPETESALVAFAAQRISKSDAMMVTWFGGEPTLCLSTIERLQAKFGELCASREVALKPASIVTNGYLLAGPTAERLRQANVTDAQITLDGPRRLHDRRRRLRNGNGTFDTILANLREAADLLKIVIRVNVDKSSGSAAGEVLEDLDRCGVLAKVQVGFAPVNAAGAVCADMTDRCFASEEFAHYQIELYRKLIGQGFYRIEYPGLAPGGHCGADSDNAYVVAPNGLLFKCWEELSMDPRHSVGDVFSDELAPRQEANLDRYLAWDAFEKPGCVECSILPLCMGGCPYHGMALESTDRGYCCSWKYNLGEMLQLRYICEERREVKK